MAQVPSASAAFPLSIDTRLAESIPFSSPLSTGAPRGGFSPLSSLLASPSPDSTPVAPESTGFADMRWGSYTRTTFDGHVPTLQGDINGKNLAIVLGVYSGAILALHYYQLHAWWSGDRGPFHFQEDWPVDLQVDKFGHFFGGYMIGYGSREALLECGLSDEAAHDWGGVMGLFYQLYVETEDGFSTKWGFSPTDAYSDIAGAGYFVAQKHIPFLQNFHEKWTYYPSPFLGKGSIAGQQRTIFDDYQGETFWWTVDVWNLLPPSAQAWYPNWLQIAVAYGAKNYSNDGSDIPDTREVYVGLDYHLLHIIPHTSSSIVNWLVQTLDNFHYPAPALQISPRKRFYFLYPFHMTL
jgi:hypothetical protein